MSRETLIAVAKSAAIKKWIDESDRRGLFKITGIERAAKVPRGTLSYIVNGSRQKATIEQLAKLEKVLTRVGYIIQD